ncbi:MAG: acetoacetate--CoA ligase, partial [Planctomycetes bacterium]|nr:acetoacetate--CoA ligase [Planctomycetota bacterium]
LDLQNYNDLYNWSVDNIADFWGTFFRFSDIIHQDPFTGVVDDQLRMPGANWFPGCRLNFAENLLRHQDERTAIVFYGESQVRRSLTFKELAAKVAQFAAALRNWGVRPGDRVAGFMPNMPESVIAMLGAASIGAIWSSSSPDFGIKGVLDRFGQIEPKVLIAADAYYYNGKRISTLDKLSGIVESLPKTEKIIVVSYDGSDISGMPDGAIAWDKCLEEDPPPLKFEMLPFNHPLYILYTSGTTGLPKSIVHSAGGTLIQHLKELRLHTDLTRDDVIFYFTTCGWMMWNWLVSALGVGATVVLYEGAPFHPDPDHLWRMAKRLGVTVFGTSPKYLAACENAGLKPGDRHDLSKLRAVLSTGSPLTVENFRWVYQNVKSDLQLASICGGTDIISCFMLGNPILPVHAGEIQCLGLGMDVRAFDADGRAVVGQKGELVCCSPFPSQPTGFWNDKDGEKYRKAYFDDYPGVWRHGDFVEMTERGGVIVHGRSDATLNPGGVRIGTAEIYRQIELLEEVVDSVVVGKRTSDADVEVCLFVVLREGRSLDDTLIDKIKKRIVEGTTRRHVPKHVKQVTAVPYTISGKKVELAVMQMIHGETVLNRDALSNPDALDQYAGIV